jgi:uncharacterized membrane protein YcaP (DUF421 family)
VALSPLIIWWLQIFFIRWSALKSKESRLAVEAKGISMVRRGALQFVSWLALVAKRR